MRSVLIFAGFWGALNTNMTSVVISELSSAQADWFLCRLLGVLWKFVIKLNETRYPQGSSLKALPNI